MYFKRYILFLSCAILIFPSCSNIAHTQPEKKPINAPKAEKKFSDNNVIIKVFPWENDERFQKIIRDKKLFLMANFSATLHEPIGGEIQNISHAADLLSGTIIPPGGIFSQNAAIGPYTKERGYTSGPMYVGNRIVTSYGGGVCKIATLLYNTAILSDLKIIERHTHSMTVPYVPAGQDATVYYGAKDVKFINNTGAEILIMAKMVGNTLHMAMYGQRKPPKITWKHETIKVIPYTTIYKKNSALPKGTEKKIIEGHDGVIVKSTLTKKYHDGRIVILDLGKRYYAPCPSVVERN